MSKHIPRQKKLDLSETDDFKIREMKELQRNKEQELIPVAINKTTVKLVRRI